MVWRRGWDFGEGLAGVVPGPIPELAPDAISAGVGIGVRMGGRVGVRGRGVRGVFGVATEPEPGETSVIWPSDVLIMIFYIPKCVNDVAQMAMEVTYWFEFEP